MALFQLGAYSLNSGLESCFKIDCDDLSATDINAIAFLISKNIKFSAVVGIPRGGVRLAIALDPYAQNGDLPILLVDDVLTTGGSMERYKEKFKGDKVIGSVIFARYPCPDWISPVFQMKMYPDK